MENMFYEIISDLQVYQGKSNYNNKKWNAHERRTVH